MLFDFWAELVELKAKSIPSGEHGPMNENGITPRRPIEREYLATLNAAVPLDSWQAICKRAADDAKAGDAKARDWLAKWLLGLETRLLTVLAAEESTAEPAAAADGEIADRRQKIDDDRRRVERHRRLFSKLNS
jgi:hypothetical protein